MPSPCPRPEVCGSCRWSHLPYEAQLKQKISDINGSFALKKLSIRCSEILPSPVIAHYRNRMDLAIDFEGRVGLREKGKWWRVIDDHTCFIADRLIEQQFSRVRDWVRKSGLSYYDRKSHEGLLRYAVIRSTTTDQTMVTIVTSVPRDDRETQHLTTALCQLSSQAKPTTTIWSQSTSLGDVSHHGDLTIIDGPGWIEETINTYRYRITPNAFFQTNPRAATLLQNTVLKFAGENHSSILDLYCGSGFFSIPLAKKGIRISGIEWVEDAIYDARINAKLNHANIDFRTISTDQLEPQELSADLVILDPPRMGMDDRTFKNLLRGRPATVIYISCNYKSFARECVRFLEYYDVASMRAIDMFPHTPHVELITKLTRRDASMRTSA